MSGFSLAFLPSKVEKPRPDFCLRKEGYDCGLADTCRLANWQIPADTIGAVGRLDAGVSLSHQTTWAEAARKADPTLERERKCGWVGTGNLQRRAGGLTGADGGASLFAAVMEAVVVHKTLRAFRRCDKRFLVLKRNESTHGRDACSSNPGGGSSVDAFDTVSHNPPELSTCTPCSRHPSAGSRRSYPGRRPARQTCPPEKSIERRAGTWTTQSKGYLVFWSHLIVLHSLQAFVLSPAEQESFLQDGKPGSSQARTSSLVLLRACRRTLEGIKCHLSCPPGTVVRVDTVEVSTEAFNAAA